MTNWLVRVCFWLLPSNRSTLLKYFVGLQVFRVIRSIEVKMFGFFFSVLKKVYVYFRRVLGNRYQSLPSTKKDLKNHQQNHHNAFSFSRIDSPSSIPGAPTATTEQSKNLPPSFNFTRKSNTSSSVYNQPERTIPRVTVKVDSGIRPKKAPDVHTKAHTVFPLSTSSSSKFPFEVRGVVGSSSSSILGALPGSTQSPSVSNKPILSRAAPDPTSHLTKSKYNVVEEGSTPLYVIPEDIKGLIKQDIVPRVLKKPLSPQTYKDYFAALLYAEDYYLEKWDGFEMKNVTLKLQEAEIHGKKGKSKHSNNDKKDDKIFVEFEIDAIPEKQPFLLSRDFASVRPSGRKVDPFQGIIFRVVRSNIVLVEFGDDFHAQHYSSRKYDVKFSFNRACLKRAHQAIAAASDMLFTKFIFPDCRPKYSSYYSTAISRIINISDSHAYLVEGSLSITKDKKLSRTGIVVRDAVVRLCQASSLNKILICAPLNSTCDVFMRSLRKEVGDSNIFRANAAFRELDGVPVDILPFCLYKEKEEVFTCPSLSQLLKFKVIISTFMSSFRLHSNGIEGGHFTHIILVDASSAIEPEIMVPLANLTTVSTKVVVTGSPGNQSGWVRSTIARQNGLRTSYFERLRKSNFYKDLNPEYITQVEDDSSLPASSNFRISHDGNERVVQFISGCMASLSTMVQLELPHVNILSKMDFVRNKKDIENYLNPEPQTLLAELNQRMAPQFGKLNKSLIELLYCEKDRLANQFEQLKALVDAGDILGASGSIKRTEKDNHQIKHVINHRS